MPSSAEEEGSENAPTSSQGRPGPSSGQKRAKRARYISIACNECKRRKIKCNGENPCRRCGHLGLDCVYAASAGHNFKESQEYKMMTSQINTLQQAVESLSAGQSMAVPRAETGDIGAAGPSSIANSSQDPMLDDRLVSGLAYTSVSRTSHATKDPIWLISKEESIRLVHVWENNIHLTMPMVNIDRVLQHLDMLHSFLGGARRAGLTVSDLPGADAISDHDTLRLKLILATAMAIEAQVNGDLSCRLFTSVVTVSESLLFKPADLDGMELLLLCAISAFHKDDEMLAWRLIGATTRMLFELGLDKVHGFEVLVTRPTARYRISLILWNCYFLDRRWSILHCFPAAMGDKDIDHYRPGHDFLFNVLELMEITAPLFSKFTLRRLRYVLLHLNEVRQIELDLSTWYCKLKDDMKFDIRTASVDNEGSLTVSPQLLISLKHKQYRISTGHPVFLVTMAIRDNFDIADVVIDVARDTIQIVSHFSQWPPFRQEYLLSAQFILPCVAVLLLAAIHAPERYQAAYQEDFHAALQLLRHEQNISYMGRKVLHVLKICSQLANLVRRSLNEPDPVQVSDLRSLPFPPDMMPSTYDRPLALGVPEANDTIDRLVDEVAEFYDGQVDARLHDFTKQEALMKIFRDLT